jgi:signal transduction histidine kinase
LSIVRFIVFAHGGNVAVESEPGRGSTFSFSIPVVSEAARLGDRKEAIA